MKTILCFHSSADLYGSDRSLLRLVTGGLPYRFVVVVPYEGPLCGKLREAGVEVVIHPLCVVRREYFSPLGLVRLGFLFLRSLPAMVGLIRTHRACATLSNTTAVLGGCHAARLAGIPHIQYVREIIEKPKLVGWAMSLLAWGSSGIVCVSRSALDHFVGYWRPLGKVATVIHNGIHTEQFARGDRERVRREWEVLSEDTVVFGFLGRISEFKGADVLVDAAARFFACNPDADARFVLAGSAFQGQEWREVELQKRIDRYQNEGMVPHDAIRRIPFLPETRHFLAATDVMVVPSTKPDPFPTVVLESMASGNPVIGSKLGGIPEMVVDGSTGMLVPARDAEALASALDHLFKERHSRESMGPAGKRRCTDEFDVEVYLRNIKDLLSRTAPAE